VRIFLRTVDLLAEGAGWLFFAVGAMLAYEVVMRYFFNAPTIWAEELARLAQVWATWLAAAHLLRSRRLIAVGVLQSRLSIHWRRLVSFFNLLVIATFSATAVFYGLLLLEDSLKLGRRTATMLDLPLWLAQAAVPLGCTLLFLQCVVEMLRLFRDPGAELSFSGEAE